MESSTPSSNIFNIEVHEKNIAAFNKKSIFNLFIHILASILVLANVDGILSFVARIDPSLEQIANEPAVSRFIVYLLILYILIYSLKKFFLPMIKIIIGYPKLIKLFKNLKSVFDLLSSRNQALQVSKDQNTLINYVQAFSLLESSLIALLKRTSWASLEIISTNLDPQSGELICEINNGTEVSLQEGIIFEVLEEPSGRTLGAIILNKCLAKKSYGQVMYRNYDPTFWSKLENLSINHNNTDLSPHSLAPIIPNHLRSLTEEQLVNFTKLVSEAKLAYSKDLTMRGGENSG